MNPEDFPIGTMSLEQFCTEHKKVALAFSGGCDSTYLLSVLVDAGLDVGVYMVDSAFQARFELDDAQRVANDLGQQLKVIHADIFSQADICANPDDRCYLCKLFIFGTIKQSMAEDGYDVLVDGTNATDNPTRRPGFRALAELGVLSPLRLAGLTKEEIRQASGKRGLFTAQKPSFSCLATKVEVGQEITAEKLKEVSRRFLGEREQAWNKTI